MCCLWQRFNSFILVKFIYYIFSLFFTNPIPAGGGKACPIPAGGGRRVLYLLEGEGVSYTCWRGKAGHIPAGGGKGCPIPAGGGRRVLYLLEGGRRVDFFELNLWFFDPLSFVKDFYKF